MLAQQMINGLALGSMYALVALGLTLVFGVLLIPNFAHGELYMLGAFFTYVLVALDWNFWLAAAAATLAVMVVGIVLDRIAFRPLEGKPALTMMISALGAATIIQQLATLAWGSESRTTPNTITGSYATGSFTITYFQIIIFALLLVSWAAVWLVLNHSRLGLSIRAVAQNRAAAQLMGISLDRTRIATFAIGAALGGIAGALLGASLPIYPTMGINPILKAFVVLVIGGVGSLWGAVLGGLLLGLVEVMVAGYISSEMQDIGTFLILVLLLLLKPEGLLGKAEVER